MAPRKKHLPSLENTIVERGRSGMSEKGEYWVKRS